MPEKQILQHRCMNWAGKKQAVSKNRGAMDFTLET